MMKKSAKDKTCRVLVAEDDPLNVLLVEQVLLPFNYDLTFVGSGLQALKAVIAGEADVVVLDYKMPEMNGLEAVRAIRAWEAQEGRPALPVIGLTASAMPDEVEQCLAAGMDTVLTKPYEINELQSLLASCCDRSRPM